MMAVWTSSLLAYNRSDHLLRNDCEGGHDDDEDQITDVQNYMTCGDEDTNRAPTPAAVARPGR